MAVWAYWAEIMNWVNLVCAVNFRHGQKMMDVNESRTNVSVTFIEHQAADSASRTMVGDAAFSRFRVSLRINSYTSHTVSGLPA